MVDERGALESDRLEVHWATLVKSITTLTLRFLISEMRTLIVVL